MIVNGSSEKLKKADLRITNQRVNLMEYFLSKDHAVANQDIESALADLDRITLYRTLKSFEEKGLIHKIIDHNGQAKYASCESDCSSEHHHHQHIHFHCKSCDQTFCVDSHQMPNIQISEDFKVEEIEIMVKGICQKCN